MQRGLNKRPPTSNPKKRGKKTCSTPSTRQPYNQKFSTTSTTGRKTQQLKRCIIKIPLNFCANVQCSWRKYSRAQPSETLAHKFYGPLAKQKIRNRQLTEVTIASQAVEGEGDIFFGLITKDPRA
jgi:hypothetical protein